MSLKYDSKLVKESREQGRPVVLSGIFQKADTLNQNKRIYPKEILEREIKNYSKIVNENRGIGCLDHEDQATISLEKVSHKVTKIWWEGNDVYGELEILTGTPNGQIALGLLEGNVQFAISSRSVGETEKTNEGYDRVKSDLLLLCFDLVAEGSTPNSWMHLKEGKEINLTSLPKSYRIQKILNDILK